MIFKKQKQIFLFIIAGGLSAVLEICLMKLFSHYIPQQIPAEVLWHGIAYPISNILSTMFAILFNYFLSVWFVFESGRHTKRREFTYFMALSVLSTIFSLVLFNILYKNIIFHPVDLYFYALSPIIMSKSIAIIIISIFNFTIKKNIVFNG